MQFILKPGGIALVGIATFILITQGIRHSLSQSGAAPNTVVASPLPSPKPALPEKSFWAVVANKKDAKPMSIDTDPLAPSGTGQVAHIHIQAPQKEDWQLQAGIGIPTVQKPGDSREISFWARTDASEAEITVSVELNYAPFEKFTTETRKITNQWQEHKVRVTFTRQVPQGKGNISFQLGKAPADCYFSGVRL